VTFGFPNVALSIQPSPVFSGLSGSAALVLERYADAKAGMFRLSILINSQLTKMDRKALHNGRDNRVFTKEIPVAMFQDMSAQCKTQVYQQGYIVKKKFKPYSAMRIIQWLYDGR
jgi:hypothetical protein